MMGLNFVLSIFMGSSFGEVIEGWIDIIGEKFFCVTNGAKFLCVVDVGSRHLSYQCLKSLLSH
jgi:hypothetical protein